MRSASMRTRIIRGNPGRTDTPGAVVMLSLADYESMRETAYLLANAANARRLIDGIEEAEAEIQCRYHYEK